MSATLWYFAYGSNMQTATFCGRRGIDLRRAFAARAAGWRLVLDKPPLIPVGEAFANIVAAPEAEVFGVVYEVTAEELAHVELTEGVLIDNYRRVEIRVQTLGAAPEELAACTLVSDQHDPALRPSARYMACLIAGAEEHGLPAAWIDFLRSVPAGPETTGAARLRPVLDELMRRPR